MLSFQSLDWFHTGDLFGIASWLGITDVGENLDPWHIARLAKLRGDWRAYNPCKCKRNMWCVHPVLLL